MVGEQINRNSYERTHSKSLCRIVNTISKLKTKTVIYILLIILMAFYLQTKVLFFLFISSFLLIYFTHEYTRE